MDKELIKVLSNLQLIHSAVKNKINMCPLSIRKEEYKAYIIFNYIRELQAEIRDKKRALNETKEYVNNHKRNLIHPLTGEEYEILDDENIVNILQIINKVLGEDKEVKNDTMVD